MDAVQHLKQGSATLPPFASLVACRARALLPRCMALLLFLQWIGCPAHCLVDATAGYEHIGCFTTAPADPGHPDPLALTLDHVCPACTALGQAVLPEPPAAPMRRVVWSVAVRFVPAPMVTEAAPRAPPVQPRAPPAFV